VTCLGGKAVAIVIESKLARRERVQLFLPIINHMDGPLCLETIKDSGGRIW
jgi:hypothetical protein